MAPGIRPPSMGKRIVERPSGVGPPIGPQPIESIQSPTETEQHEGPPAGHDRLQRVLTSEPESLNKDIVQQTRREIGNLLKLSAVTEAAKDRRRAIIKEIKTLSLAEVQSLLDSIKTRKPGDLPTAKEIDAHTDPVKELAALEIITGGANHIRQTILKSLPDVTLFNLIQAARSPILQNN